VTFASSYLDPVKPSDYVSPAMKAAKTQGKDVIGLRLGEPDFHTPAHIVAAAHQAAFREKGLAYAVDEVIVSKRYC